MFSNEQSKELESTKKKNQGKIRKELKEVAQRGYGLIN